MRVRSLDLLRNVIAATGLTQRQFAYHAEVHHSTLANLLRGHRTSCSPWTAVRIAQVSGVDPTLLFSVSIGDANVVADVSA